MWKFFNLTLETRELARCTHIVLLGVCLVYVIEGYGIHAPPPQMVPQSMNYRLTYRLVKRHHLVFLFPP